MPDKTKTTVNLLLVYTVLIVSITACKHESPKDGDIQEIIDVINEIYIDEKSAVYHQAISFDVLDRYIDLPLTFNQLTSFFPLPEGLDTLFNEEVMSSFSTQLSQYKPLQFDQGDFDDLRTIEDSEIPQYIKDGYRPPAPNEEVTITNLFYLSTPLFYKEKAIVFTRSGPHYSLNVNFFIKKEKWERVAINSLTPKNYSEKLLSSTPSFSNNDYEVISWIGLQETDYYLSLSGLEKTAITNNIQSAKNKADENCN